MAESDDLDSSEDSTLEYHKDCRGVLRGRCLDCGCDKYDGGIDGKKCVDCGHVPGKHTCAELPSSPPPVPLHSAGLGLMSPSELLPPDQICLFKGCTAKRCKEGNKTHEFCRRRHAKLHQQDQETVLSQDDMCKTPGCKNRRRKRENGGGYFDFCSLYCRDNQQKEGQAMVPMTMRDKCLLPGCKKFKYQDPCNRRIHDFCSRTHAAEASQNGTVVMDEITITLTSAQERTAVTTKFTAKWSKGTCPTVEHVFSVCNAKLKKIWTSYKDALATPSTEEYFHGTKLMCDIIGSKALCSDQECGICGIANIGFDRRCIRKNINFQRFGHGFYLAPNSSKCHDYTQGKGGFRAMLLFDVCPGNKYQLKRDDETLTSPPEGYHSIHGKSGISLNYDELVLYNADAALPKYVILYRMDGDHKIAK